MEKMLSDLELNVLAGFFPRPHQCLPQVIQRRIAYHTQDIYHTLVSLTERKIVEVVWLGGATGYSLVLEKDETASGYQFYVRLRIAELKRRYGNAAAAIESWAEGTEGDIVLAYGNHARGTAARSEPVGAIAVLDLKDMKSWSNVPDSKNQREEGAVREKGSQVSSVGVKPVLYTLDEFRELKKTDLDLFRDIVNFGFPIKGVGLYYELLYLETGI